MNFVKNYRDWIKDEWIDEIMRCDGWSVPRDFFQDNKIWEEIKLGIRDPMHPTEMAIYETYGTDDVHFQLLEDKDLSFKIDPPWVTNEIFEWWVVKMYPGQYIPVHRDNIRGDDIDTKRYWMPLTEYDPGHIFLYENTSVSNYSKGDLYLYDETQAWHGAINIGSSVRIVLQLSTYYKEYRKYQ